MRARSLTPMGPLSVARVSIRASVFTAELNEGVPLTGSEPVSNMETLSSIMIHVDHDRSYLSSFNSRFPPVGLESRRLYLCGGRSADEGRHLDRRSGRSRCSLC